MPIATFDTLKFANTLKAAGVPEKHAEAQAVAYSEVVQGNFKDLVTKSDLTQAIDDVEQRLTAKIDNVEQRLTARIDNCVADLKVQIAQVRGEQILLRWMMGATFACVLAALGLLARLLFVLPR